LSFTFVFSNISDLLNSITYFYLTFFWFFALSKFSLSDYDEDDIPSESEEDDIPTSSFYSEGSDSYSKPFIDSYLFVCSCSSMLSDVIVVSLVDPSLTLI
jgi:hypothetical protein